MVPLICFVFMKISTPDLNYIFMVITNCIKLSTTNKLKLFRNYVKSYLLKCTLEKSHHKKSPKGLI